MLSTRSFLTFFYRFTACSLIVVVLYTHSESFFSSFVAGTTLVSCYSRSIHLIALLPTRAQTQFYSLSDFELSDSKQHIPLHQDATHKHICSPSHHRLPCGGLCPSSATCIFNSSPLPAHAYTANGSNILRCVFTDSELHLYRCQCHHSRRLPTSITGRHRPYPLHLGHRCAAVQERQHDVRRQLESGVWEFEHVSG